MTVMPPAPVMIRPVFIGGGTKLNTTWTYRYVTHWGET